MNNTLREEFRNHFRNASPEKLVDALNSQVGVCAWVTARMLYLEALRVAFLASGLDCSAFIQGGHMDLIYVRLDGNKVVPTGEKPELMLKSTVRTTRSQPSSMAPTDSDPRGSTRGKVERIQLPQGIPSLEALVAMSKYLTGRDPTPEEMQRAQESMARIEAQVAEHRAQQAGSSPRANAATSSGEPTGTTTSQPSSTPPKGSRHGSIRRPRTKAEWLRQQFFPENPEFPLDAEIEAAIPEELPGEVPTSLTELYADE